MVQNVKIKEPWKLRFGETDAQTRGSGRAPVTMLPSRTAIINVYQLVNKMKRGGAAERKWNALSKKKISGGEGSKAGKYRWGLPQTEAGIIDGIKYDTYGNPMAFLGETRKEYNQRTFAFINKYKKLEFEPVKEPVEKPVKNKTKPAAKPAPAKSANKSEKSVNEPPTNKQRNEETEAEFDKKHEFQERLRKEQEDADKQLKSARANDPKYKLEREVYNNKILQEPSYGKYANDPAYSERRPIEDYNSIMKSIDGIKKKKIPFQKPTDKNYKPPIIAITPTKAQPPRYYFIKNELIESRKRRPMVSKTKRPVKKLHGNKRKVVMKKGGKR
jgi:hypothetical protein